MMSEKFLLKWDDFHSSVSQSFSKLRTESHFNDVTLVSEDGDQMAAHKVVLSASSSFFRKILIDNPHANPLLYLGGVSSHNLSLVLEYIYQGEVQIHQEHLDGFLKTAKKLTVEGLLSKLIYKQYNKEVKEDLTVKIEGSLSNPESDISTYKCENDDAEVKEDLTARPSNKIHTENEEKAKVKYALGNQFKDMLGQKRKKLYHRTTEGNFECLACGKFGNNHANMRKHVEIHIEGLSFICQLCGKIFSSSNSFYRHCTKFHK